MSKSQADFRAMMLGLKKPAAEEQEELDRDGKTQDGERHVLEVEDSKVGLIVGRAGATIKKMQEDTGARIKISQKGDYVPGTDKRRVTVTGEREQVEACVKLVERALGGAPSRGGKGGGGRKWPVSSGAAPTPLAGTLDAGLGGERTKGQSFEDALAAAGGNADKITGLVMPQKRKSEDGSEGDERAKEMKLADAAGSELSKRYGNSAEAYAEGAARARTWRRCRASATEGGLGGEGS